MEAPGAQGPQVTPEIQPQIQSNVQMPLEAAGGGQTREQIAQAGNEAAQHLNMAIQMKVIQANAASVDARMAGAVQESSDLYRKFDQTKEGNTIAAQKDLYAGLKDIGQKYQQSAQDLNSDVARNFQEKWEAHASALNNLIQQKVDKESTNYINSSSNLTIAKYKDMALLGDPTTPAGLKSTMAYVEMAHNELRENIILNKQGMAVDENNNPIMETGPDGKPQAKLGPAGELAIRKWDEDFVKEKAQSLLNQGDANAAFSWLKGPFSESILKENPKDYSMIVSKVGDEASKVNSVSYAKQSLASLGLYDKDGNSNLGNALEQVDKMPGDLIHKRDDYHAAVKQAWTDGMLADDASKWKQMQQTGGKLPIDTPEKVRSKYEGEWKTFQEHQQKSDMKTYYGLNDMFLSTDKDDMNDAAKVNLLDYKQDLKDSDYKHFQNLQAQMNANNPKADISKLRSQTEPLFEAMHSVGIEPKNLDDPEVLKIRSAMDDAVKTSGKELDRKGYQDLAWDVVKNHVVNRGKEINNNLPDSSGISTVKPRTIDDLPEERAESIMRYLRKRGDKNPDEDFILKMNDRYPGADFDKMK